MPNFPLINTKKSKNEKKFRRRFIQTENSIQAIGINHINRMEASRMLKIGVSIIKSP